MKQEQYASQETKQNKNKIKKHFREKEHFWKI